MKTPLPFRLTQQYLLQAMMTMLLDMCLIEQSDETLKDSWVVCLSGPYPLHRVFVVLNKQLLRTADGFHLNTSHESLDPYHGKDLKMSKPPALRCWQVTR